MTNSNIMILEKYKIVLRKDHLMMDDEVKLVTGGKTGHEPLFINYVGPGMLTAAVVGSSTSSPSSSDIYVCFKELSHNHNAGILAIVPNSFEEVINFGLGIEKARCKGILVDMVTIGDDCYESSKLRFGRRCLAGIVLAYKIAGAMAEDKKNMKEIFIRLKKLCMGTISCHISKMAFIGTDLNAGTGLFVAEDNVCKIIKTMLDYLVDSKKYFSLPITSKSSYLLMVNSYTCDKLFLYSCLKEILQQLSYREITIVRVYAGTFVSGERGFSVTLLDSENDIKLLRYVDCASSCHFWPRIDRRGVPLIVKGPSLPDKILKFTKMGPVVENKEFIDIPLKFACKALVTSEAVLNRLDGINHNFGTSILPAITTINKRCNEKKFPKQHPHNLLSLIGYICQDNISDIQGTIFYIFFMGAAQAFLSYSREVNVTFEMWVEALSRGVDSVKAYTQINENDLSLLTALSPFVFALKHHIEKKTRDLDHMLEDALKITNNAISETFDYEVHGKKKGMPEVAGQTGLICLTAIIEGYRIVTRQVDGKQLTPTTSDVSPDESSNGDNEIILL
nr:triokinase/FMN cyclase-like isoform X2 [Halyomorpha halys]XP_024214449.1 triokinase/FMN cyclase-like isoform X2 [Halyomorpha halys]